MFAVGRCRCCITKETAQSPSTFAYIAGRLQTSVGCSLFVHLCLNQTGCVLELGKHFRVGGAEIVNYKSDLPIKSLGCTAGQVHALARRWGCISSWKRGERIGARGCQTSQPTEEAVGMTAFPCGPAYQRVAHFQTR